MQHGMETWKQLEQIHRYGYSYSTVFSDFLDVCLNSLLSFTNNLSRPNFVERFKQNKLTGQYEDAYMQIVERYKENKTRPQGQRPADYFAQAWAYLQKETLGFKQDILGDLFMKYISHGEHGQFFTPTPIADMMAQMVGNKDTATVSDPCCGSGRFFISMAKLNDRAHFVGVDLSPTCAKMTALNMWLFDLNADIYCGDSLSMKMSWLWRIRKGGYIYDGKVEALPEAIQPQIRQQAQQVLFDTEDFKKAA